MMTVVIIVFGAIAVYALFETMFTDSSQKYYRDEDENDDYFV